MFGRDKDSGSNAIVGGEMGGDEYIRVDTFNAAMKGVKEAIGSMSDGFRDGISSLNERLAAIESQNRDAVATKVVEAKEDGRNEARLDAIEKHLWALTWALTGLCLGFAGQLLWWIFTKVAH